eukprot:s721_g17.t3
MGAPRCLPVGVARKSTKQPSPRDAVQKLTDEVEQLLSSPSSSESPSKKTDDLWKDVHNHLRAILNMTAFCVTAILHVDVPFLGIRPCTLQDQPKGLRHRAKGQAEEAAHMLLTQAASFASLLPRDTIELKGNIAQDFQGEDLEWFDLADVELQLETNGESEGRTHANAKESKFINVPKEPGHEHDASINFEWQFDILPPGKNHLPRDTALALMDFLKSQQRELSKTSRYANELSLVSSMDQIQQASVWACECVLLICEDQRKHPLCRCWVGVSILLALSVCLLALFATRRELLAPVSHRLPDGLSEASLVRHGAETGAAASPPEADRWSRQTQVFQQGDGSGKIKETTVREMTLRETTTREYDPKTPVCNFVFVFTSAVRAGLQLRLIQQLQTENLQMKLQLERLWLDIDDAEKKGQDHVCWSL